MLTVSASQISQLPPVGSTDSDSALTVGIRRHPRTGNPNGVASFVHPSADLCTELASMSRALIPFGIALKMTLKQKGGILYHKGIKDTGWDLASVCRPLPTSRILHTPSPCPLDSG